MFDHLSIQCADPEASATFYDAVLAPLGGRRCMESGSIVGFGVSPKPELFVLPGEPGDGFRACNIAFQAPDRAAVQAFVSAAVEAGAQVLQPARLQPKRHPNYYAGFVRDPDGNNVGAICHAAE